VLWLKVVRESFFSSHRIKVLFVAFYGLASACAGHGWPLVGVCIEQAVSAHPGARKTGFETDVIVDVAGEATAQ
jgi:hypothetical protein